ncbi:MAG: gliding motility lipoprotein GldD [Bacteroidales bacterium]|nr:gliding motility lipoprotein GldD [Bacteroidales bacterium]
MKLIHRLMILAAFSSVFIQCSENSIPRPRGYFRINLPEKSYVNLPDSFPYNFKISDLVRIKQDKSRISQQYWINIEYPSYKAEIHISYHPVESNIQKLLDDTYSLTYKHIVKADAIDEVIINYPEKRVFGTFYDISGDAASQIQFFVTDSVKHYFRAALYFNTEVNRDSINPVVEYIKEDMKIIYETLEWRDEYIESY